MKKRPDDDSAVLVRGYRYDSKKQSFEERGFAKFNDFFKSGLGVVKCDLKDPNTYAIGLQRAIKDEEGETTTEELNLSEYINVTRLSADLCEKVRSYAPLQLKQSLTVKEKALLAAGIIATIAAVAIGVYLYKNRKGTPNISSQSNQNGGEENVLLRSEDEKKDAQKKYEQGVQAQYEYLKSIEGPVAENAPTWVKDREEKQLREQAERQYSTRAKDQQELYDQKKYGAPSSHRVVYTPPPPPEVGDL